MVIDAAIARDRYAHDRAAWLAWHTAALLRVKNMPPLSRLLAKQERRSNPRELERRRLEHEELVRKFREAKRE